MREYPVQDNPVVQDYLWYIQDQMARGIPVDKVEKPEDYFARMLQQPEGLVQYENTDPRLRTIQRIYGVLLGKK